MSWLRLGAARFAAASGLIETASGDGILQRLLRLVHAADEVRREHLSLTAADAWRRSPVPWTGDFGQGEGPDGRRRRG
jgi:hypothetical protein